MSECQKTISTDRGICQHGNFLVSCGYCSEKKEADNGTFLKEEKIEKSEINSADLKKYAKKEHTEELQQKVGEAREIRRQYFDRKALIFEQLSKVREQIAEKKESLADLTKELQEIAENLDKKSDSIFTQVIEYFAIKKLEQKLVEKRPDIPMLEEEISNLLILEDEFSSLGNDKRELEEVKKLFAEFYDSKIDDLEEHQKSELERIEQEEIARQVETISRDYEVVFVHGIYHNHAPGSNSLLQEEGVSFGTKVKLAISLEPTISTSTLKTGIRLDATWAASGLVLIKGRVETANMGDAGTKARGLYRRENPNIENRNNIIDNIKYSVMAPEGRMGEHYNELVVSSPKFAGMYLEDGFDTSGLPLRKEDFFKTAEELNLPTYYSRNGEFFELSLNKETGELEIGEKVDLATIREKAREFSQEEKELIFKEILEKETPFDLERILPEAQLVSEYISGIRRYMELLGDSLAGNSNGTGLSVADLGINIGRFIASVAERESLEGLQLLKEISFPNGKNIKYFEKDGKVYKLELDSHGSWDKPFKRVNSEYINVSKYYPPRYEYVGGLANIPKPLEFLQMIVNEIEKINKEDIKKHPELAITTLEKMAFYLYGFAEVAGEFGDTEIQQQALELAKKLKKEEEYKEIINRRLDKKGRFKISKEDLM